MTQDEFTDKRDAAIASLLPMLGGLTISARVLVVFMEAAYAKAYMHGLDDAARAMSRRAIREYTDVEALQ